MYGPEIRCDASVNSSGRPCTPWLNLSLGGENGARELEDASPSVPSNAVAMDIEALEHEMDDAVRSEESTPREMGDDESEVISKPMRRLNLTRKPLSWRAYAAKREARNPMPPLVENKKKEQKHAKRVHFFIPEPFLEASSPNDVQTDTVLAARRRTIPRLHPIKCTACQWADKSALCTCHTHANEGGALVEALKTLRFGQ